MRNQRTEELAQRLNTAWQQWKTIELSDDLELFLGDMQATTNGRMVESLVSPMTTTYFMLSGEEQIYHFYYAYENDTWYCKA